MIPPLKPLDTKELYKVDDASFDHEKEPEPEEEQEEEKEKETEQEQKTEQEYLSLVLPTKPGVFSVVVGDGAGDGEEVENGDGAGDGVGDGAGDGPDTPLPESPPAKRQKTVQVRSS